MSSLAAPFTNSGTVAPSGGAGGSGFLLINGFYTQTAGGAMDFTLGGGSNSVLVENVFAESIANFQAGSVIDASFFAGFDPSSGCAATFGVCETFDIFDTEALGASAASGTSRSICPRFRPAFSGSRWTRTMTRSTWSSTA